MSHMPSIGTATGSRVDSAAKHIMACKVDSRLLGCWTANPAQSDPTSYLHTNKMKWCMHKDEIVLNTTKKKNNEDGSAKAYPMVITTVGEMHPLTKQYISALYSMPHAHDFFTYWNLPEDEIKRMTLRDSNQQVTQWQNMENKEFALQQILSLPEFRCQGVALGQAWASYMSGDTVASVLVGGMMTVLNGHFTMHTGDEVQWYFDFESSGFQHGHRNGNPNGFRVQQPDQPDAKRQKRADYFDQRLYGTGGGYGKSLGVKDTGTVVRIKSYRMHKEGMVHHDHFGDKISVFAKCISGGRPFDMVDIMLMTQSS